MDEIKKKNGKIGNVSIRGWNEEKRFVWRYPCFNLKSKEAYGRPRSGRDVVQPNELTRMRWRERIMFVRRTGLSAPEKLETTTITRLVSREQRINQREASFLTYRNWDQNNWRQINRFIFYLVFFIISSDLSYHLTSSNYTRNFLSRSNNLETWDGCGIRSSRKLRIFRFDLVLTLRSYVPI